MGLIKVSDDTTHIDINGSKFPKNSLAFIDYKDNDETVEILYAGKSRYMGPYTDYRNNLDASFASKDLLMTYLSGLGF